LYIALFCFVVFLQIAKLKRFNFFKTALCSEKPEPWNPEPKPNNTFATNETIYVYAEIFGWKYVLVDQLLHRNLTLSIKILDSEGKTVSSQLDTLDDKHEVPSGRFGTSRYFGFLEAGNYTVEVEVTDHNSGETITWKEELEVIDTDSDTALTFKEEELFR
ncbi:hypothetical protein ACFLTY_04470, partial [Chloroflexota bacterium]